MTKAETTPPRHNYANIGTPIASAKRPREASERLSKTPPRSAQMSPMHPPRENYDQEDWVNRKVDGLFAPVLSFLNSAEEVVPVSTGTTEEEDESISCEDSMCVSELGDDEFNPWQFIKYLPNYDSVKHLCPPVTLPPKSKNHPPLTLVLDLDETLVHCTVDPIETPDLVFPVQFNAQTYQVHVRLRPHLQTFLDKIKGKFEVIVFTASQKVYADTLLNLIDPDNQYFHHRLFRESCLAVEGNFLKDLNVLGRDLKTTILVDNSPHAFGYQVNNGIPIESWFEDPNDRELLKLERFLKMLQGKKDIRPVIANKFQCQQLIENAPAF